MSRDDRKTIVVVLMVCSICILCVFFFSRKTNMNNLSIVDDYGDYLSVVDEVDKYISYVSSGDAEDILDLLDSNYVKANNISNWNIDDNIDDFSVNSVLESKDIYYVDINDNKLYYVTGKIVDMDFDGTSVVNDDYKVVVLNDALNNSFSIYPVNNENYEKVINSIKKINITSNSENEMTESNALNDVQVCKLYFSNYLSKIYNDPKTAYELLSDKMKKEYSSYNVFSSYIKYNMANIVSTSKLCDKKEVNNSRIYTVVDSNENVYRFEEKGIMNYEVDFYFNDEEVSAE